MEVLKIVTVVLMLQISLNALAQNSTQSENDEFYDKITQLDSSVDSDSNASSTNVPRFLENSTITNTDNNLTLTTLLTTTEKILNETTESTTVSTTTADMLIPPATVEAQIEKLDVTSKKPSRIQVIAAQ